jgi:hypothetical protein
LNIGYFPVFDQQYCWLHIEYFPNLRPAT